ncbi:uncharacterized protein LOC132704955 [Cylas formicarius]|uniref:uncharacterized protein LOC132704955 n=1 Tax=Cylas formicarius TaxID=197179 RepID=UPI0029587AC1|nr:uncharacterized protein LOC132704955 [Cylas formicarius]
MRLDDPCRSCIVFLIVLIKCLLSEGVPYGKIDDESISNQNVRQAFKVLLNENSGVVESEKRSNAEEPKINVQLKNSPFYRSGLQYRYDHHLQKEITKKNKVSRSETYEDFPDYDYYVYEIPTRGHRNSARRNPHAPHNNHNFYSDPFNFPQCHFPHHPRRPHPHPRPSPQPPPSSSTTTTQLPQIDIRNGRLIDVRNDGNGQNFIFPTE